MDGQRFDALTRTMATGASRRRALRLAGGSLAAALLTAVVRGRQASAAEVIVTNCINYGPPPHQGGAGAQVTVVQPGELVVIAKTCGGCGREGSFCAALLNPANELICRCLTL